MKYNFDEVIDRKCTDCLKYDALDKFFGKCDVIPLWVADMDFATPDFIMEALKERLEHPVLGYSTEPEDYKPSIIDWIKELHGVEVKSDWITYIPGIVKGIGFVLQCFTKPGDEVVIMPPVYHPFRLVPEKNDRKVVEVPLILSKDGKYKIDFAKLEEVLSRDSVKLLILANPHNPVGIVWDREDLAKIAEMCVKHGVLVISDEIHSEMAFEGKTHIPFYSVDENARKCSITFAAPTKTFNVAGVVSSYAIVPDRALRHKFYSYLEVNELNAPHLFAPIATVAAYRKGAQWRKEMMDYLQGNFDFIEQYCKEKIKVIHPMRPEASYLVWLDCREMGLNQKELVEFFLNNCGLALNDGATFGTEGEGFMRLNAGCPRSILEEAFSRIFRALNSD